jgi:hypothetical protein
VFTFVLFFLREYSRHRFSSAESEALLPLADETPRVAGEAAAVAEHKPAHACKNNGSCAACQRRALIKASAGHTPHHA